MPAQGQEGGREGEGRELGGHPSRQLMEQMKDGLSIYRIAVRESPPTLSATCNHPSSVRGPFS